MKSMYTFVVKREGRGTREEGEEEKEEKKEIKLWYRGLLNEGGSILPDPRSASVRPSAPSVRVRPSVRACNHRVLANDSNQFVVFPSREPTNQPTDERTNGGAAVMSCNNFPSEVVEERARRGRVGPRGLFD